MNTLRFFSLLIFLTLAASLSEAAPVLWSANIEFSDGGTVTGTFVYDADLGKNGTFSQIDISTQGGVTGLAPTTYHDVILQTDFFIDLVPDSSLSSLVGQQVLTLAWVGYPGYTQYGVSDGLSDAGGLVQVFSAQEEYCANANCTERSGGARLENGVDGVFSAVVATPEPAAPALVGLAIIMLLLWKSCFVNTVPK